MHRFLANNRDELVARCKVKVAARPSRAATEAQLGNGVPLFLEQLRLTIEAEEGGHSGVSLRISGRSGGDSHSLSEIGVAATAHGKQLLELGYTVDQVVHDYGDLCQAITDLAVERGAPFSVHHFRTLNRCLDNAIADAVTEFSAQRDLILARRQADAENERLGFVAHELRNALGTVVLAFKALEMAGITVSGATGGVLKRGLAGMATLIEQLVDEVRDKSDLPARSGPFSLAAFIAQAEQAAALDAGARGCTLRVPTVDRDVWISGDRDSLLSALANLLQNAFKFTHARTEVTLTAHAVGDRVLIEVQDQCGGLTVGTMERMFVPFAQRGDDRTGLGLGLSIARHMVEAEAGTLGVRNLPGVGCAFTIDLPRCSAP